MTTVFYIMEYLFEILISYFFFSNKFETKHSKKYTFIFYIVSFVLQFSINHIGIANLNLFTFLLCNFFLCLLCYKSNILQSIFNSFILTALMLITELCILYISGLLFQNEIYSYTSNDLVFLIQSSSSKILYFLFTYIILKLSNKEYRNTTNFKKTSLLFILPIASILLLIGIAYMTENYKLNNYIFTLFSIFTILLMYSNIIVFWIHESTIKAEQQNTELRLQQQKAEIDTTYYSILQNQYENSNILIHDIKRHLMSIKELSKSNDNNGISRYIDNLYENYDVNYIKKYSSNKLVNAIINRYVILFKDSKIDFFCDIRDIDFSFISDNDLTAILDNLLENAFEASKNSENKKIELLIYLTNVNYIAINLTNSYSITPTIKNGKLVTVKEKSSIHGYGIKSIERTIKNHDGIMSFSFDESAKEFNTKIVLKTSHDAHL